MADKTPLEIEFPAEVIRVQTMESGAIRVILDMPEYCIPQMALLADCKRQGTYLQVVATEND